MWDVINNRAMLIREPNEVRVLRLVRDIGQISRIEIAKICKLSKASVSEIVVQLIEAGFLEEIGKADSTKKGGRRRILLRFQPLAGLVAGVDIKMNHAKVAIVDLNASLLGELTFSYGLGASPSEVLGGIITSIDSLLKSRANQDSKLIGIGIGVPGLIDYHTNTLQVADTMKGWQGANLNQEIEAKFKVPVYVENDVKAMTLGEYLFGGGKGVSDLVHIWIGDGIGAGIIINGKLYRGITASAGEIGYNDLGFEIRSEDRFPLLYRGQKDLGDILSDRNFIESYRRESNDELSIEEILERGATHEPLASALVEEFVSLLSIVCINLINTLNPESILLNGRIVQGDRAIIHTVQEKIRADILSVPAEAVRIRSSALGENGTVLGAAGLVLYELFEPMHSLSLRAGSVLEAPTYSLA